MAWIRRLAVALALAALLGSPEGAKGQGAPLTVEGRGGMAVPLGSFADGSRVGEGTDAGPAFGFEVVLGSAGRRSLYAGFAQLRFGCGSAGCPAGHRYVATGVNLGVRLAVAPGRRVNPWVGLGATSTRVESPGVTGSPAGVSELGVGAEAALGLFVQAGRWVAFTPAVRLARAGTELPGGATLALRYVVADLGITLVF